MLQEHLSGKLAVILHADIADSTVLVRQDEQLAHSRIQETFQRLKQHILQYHGRVRELRGDALLLNLGVLQIVYRLHLPFKLIIKRTSKI